MQNNEVDKRFIFKSLCGTEEIKNIYWHSHIFKKFLWIFPQIIVNDKIPNLYRLVLIERAEYW